MLLQEDVSRARKHDFGLDGTDEATLHEGRRKKRRVSADGVGN